MNLLSPGEFIALKDSHPQLSLGHFVSESAPILLRQDLVVEARSLLDEALQRRCGTLFLRGVFLIRHGPARADAQNVALGPCLTRRKRESENDRQQDGVGSKFPPASQATVLNLRH